eukprot:TRINITY_DN927_c0_g1_i1.p1 TRINITY_DN927_c0_g1~~TRINITY_DN927_c0_g1_i1.p1  ORF type:complete len:467 (+),score=139.64 TRINITY_DN927_c0_g1_i1:3-1403(+)
MFKVTSVLLFALFCVAFSATHKAHPCNFQETCGLHDFKRVAQADSDRIHTVKLHLRQNNFGASCPSLLDAVSNPASPSYGEHYSFEQIGELTWDQEAIDAVHLFLRQHNVAKYQSKVAPNGEYITVKAPISTLEKMFSAEFHVFKSESQSTQIVRSESYTIPSHMESYIDLVHGIHNFPLYNKHSKIAGLVKAVDGSVTPQLIWKTYNMPNSTDATPLADQAVFEGLGQSYSPADLKQFQKTYKLHEQDIKKVIGPNSPNSCASDPNDCGEANLDVQYIMALAQTAPTVFWSIANEDGDIFLDFIEAVAKDSKPPQVFSISYGGPEEGQDVADMIRFNTEVCKMGLRGLTVFVSSGDDGVAGSQARGNPSACGFSPQYPANCPYVTTVGATMGPESGNPEVVCQSDLGSLITSGGGFSNLFPTPAYQKTLVTTYLKTASNLPPTSMFNTTGRYAHPSFLLVTSSVF